MLPATALLCGYSLQGRSAETPVSLTGGTATFGDKTVANGRR